MIKDSFFKDLAPVEAEMIRDYVLHEMCPELEGTANAENLNRSVKRCAHCGSERIIRYGYNNKTQRFECKNCGRTFSSTTGTMFYASNTDFETWSAFIDCEVRTSTKNVVFWNMKTSLRKVILLSILFTLLPEVITCNDQIIKDIPVFG